MTHTHGFEVLWDEENDRLFAFCTSGGIAECSLEIECDEIERRLNATWELSAERANRIAYQLEKGKSAEALRAYARLMGGIMSSAWSPYDEVGDWVSLSEHLNKIAQLEADNAKLKRENADLLEKGKHLAYGCGLDGCLFAKYADALKDGE